MLQVTDIINNGNRIFAMNTSRALSSPSMHDSGTLLFPVHIRSRFLEAPCASILTQSLYMGLLSRSLCFRFFSFLLFSLLSLLFLDLCFLDLLVSESLTSSGFNLFFLSCSICRLYLAANEALSASASLSHYVRVCIGGAPAVTQHHLLPLPQVQNCIHLRERELRPSQWG
jgi:hypothetical protein